MSFRGVFSVFIICFVVSGHAADDAGVMEKEAIALVGQFVGKLKPELKSALQNLGMAEAVKICSEKAPAIAKQLSIDSGWQIKRVSLRPRNKASAVADEWEKQVLQQFALQAEENKVVNVFRQSQLGRESYRFMQAQKVEGVCLGCHGNNIDEKTKAALDKYYPNDNAQGYSLGDVRGAFSLRRSL